MSQSAKKPYSPPQLQIYGDLRQITQNKGSAASDNPSAKQSGTHLGNQS